MPRLLRRTVTIDGVRYRAGTSPPGDVADRITNPTVWEPGPDGADEVTAVAAGAHGDAPAPAPPPRAGKGSSTPAWAAFAARTAGGQETDWADLGRDEIITRLESDGVIDPEE